MSLKHLLIDYENIQPKNLETLNANEYKLWLFLGKNQTKMDIPTVKTLLRFEHSVECIQVSKSGKNALDFYIAYYIGRILALNPNDQVCIFSRDTDYDALLQHIHEDTAYQASRVEILERLPASESTAKPVLPKTANVTTPIQTTTAPKTTPTPTSVPKSTPTPTPQSAPTIDKLSEENPQINQDSIVHKIYQVAIKYWAQDNHGHPSNYQDAVTLLHKLNPFLNAYSESERQNVIAQALQKLAKDQFISIENQHIQYHFASSDFQKRMLQIIHKHKPKTKEKACNVLKSYLRSWLEGEPKPDFLLSLVNNMIEKKWVFEQNGKLLYEAPKPTTKPKPAPTVSPTSQPKIPISTLEIEPILKYLRSKANSRPKSATALKNMIHIVFKNKTTPEQLENLLEQLKQKRHITVQANQNIQYHL